MLELDQLLERYKIRSQHLEKICNALGERELEFRLMPESNSATWILAHLIAGYIDFVELAGPERARELLVELRRPDESELAAMPLSEVLDLMGAYREAFPAEVERFRRRNNLVSVCPAGEGKTWVDLILTVMNHEIYHCGRPAYVSKILQQKALEGEFRWVSRG